jgi:hypothetical protein
MDQPIPSGLGSDLSFYAEHFMDSALWAPFVREVCSEFGLTCRQIEPGLPGSFPTFIVEVEAGDTEKSVRTVVVKLFGPLFEGADCFKIEREMGHFLTQYTLPIHSPMILGEGQLEPEWSYLIFEHVPGKNIGRVWQQLLIKARQGVAIQMGKFMKELHKVTATEQISLPESRLGLKWEGFEEFLQAQLDSCYANHKKWGELPSQLLAQIPGYLLPIGDLVDLSSPPYVIHADLTGDHLLGRVWSSEPDFATPSASNWESLAVIDWGDARQGNILYELVALHVDLFQSDLALLKVFLDAYDLPDFYQHDFAHKALCMTLLHQFPMPKQVYESYHDASSLDRLAQQLFGV